MGESLPWTLLGVHSSTIDIGSRDFQVDETLGLNNAWYADILMTLTEHQGSRFSRRRQLPSDNSP